MTLSAEFFFFFEGNGHCTVTSGPQAAQERSATLPALFC